VHTGTVGVRDALFAGVYDRMLAPMEQAGLREWRRALLADLTGTVIEVGAGTGVNLPLYPASVERLVLTDPSPAMLTRLRATADRETTDPDSDAGPRSVEVVEAHADALPIDDGEADAVVSTLVLCSVPDPGAVLAEARRVLRPDGRLVFLEHVAAEDRPARLRWQRRLDHVWPHVAGGCHLDRRTGVAIADAGFVLGDVTRESARKASPLVRAMIRGIATSP
jgi:ubiquinone/menaquinone biosynthesis C-methylase UbiE